MNSPKTIRFLYGIVGALVLSSIMTARVDACTIFVLTDTNRVLFCNNEDWLNPKTRIWFIPGTGGHYGCAYVGFDDGSPQVGLNTAGLAFDWVGGFDEQWEPDPSMQNVRGNPVELMLETCTTIEDAISFFQKYRYYGFSQAKMLVADHNGASAIIGAKNGLLQIDRSNQSRGFGYGSRMLEKMLATFPSPTVANGASILRACLQEGTYATKYSNIFDLKSGEIFLFPFPGQNDHVKLNLAVELKKRGHYYDIPQIRKQMTQACRPLLFNMKHVFLDELRPIPDKEPAITKHLSAIFQDISTGTMHPDDYNADMWKELSPAQKKLEVDLKKLGQFISMTLVDCRDEDGRRSYRYRMEFTNATLLQHFALDKQNKVALIQTESIEVKSKVGRGSN